MTDGALVALTVLAALGSGVVAGIFFAFSAFIMTALGRLPPDEGMAAMQSINTAVINPWFLGAFFGTAAVAAILAGVALSRWGDPDTPWLAAGGLLYLLGTVLVTMARNVPLNEALAAAKPDSAEGAELWNRYRSRWTVWNHVRTVAALLAAAAFIVAML